MANPLYTFYRTYGNNIFFKYRKNGAVYAKKVNFYQPSLYTPSEDGEAQSIYGYPLKQIKFDNIRDAKSFAEQYKDVDGFEVEGNSNYGNQFIIEMYQGQMPKFQPSDVRLCILDIEVKTEGVFPEPDQANYPINGITFYDSFTDTYYCIGDKVFVHDKECIYVGHLNVQFQLVNNEVELLHAMLSHFRDFQYDLTCGWNSETFDMPYIVNRCFKIVGEPLTTSSLSPFNMINFQEFKGNFGKSQTKVDIVGLPHLDYMNLYKKHVPTPRESYRLDYIAKEELGDGKVEYNESGTLENLYEDDPQKYYTYNIVDVDLIRRMDDKLGLINVTFTLAYYTLSNFEDTLGTVKLWEQLIAKHLYNKGLVPLFRSKGSQGRDFDGAFVHPTQVGMHKWVTSIDLNSLYPMNEIQYNISSETYVAKESLPIELQEFKSKHTLKDLVDGSVDLSMLEQYNLCMAGNFEFYTKSKVGFMSEIKDELYLNRKAHKKTMLTAESRVELLKGEAKRRGLNV